MSATFTRLARDLRTARHVPTPQLLHRARFLGLRRLYAALPALPLGAARRRAAGAAPRRDLPRAVPGPFCGGTSPDVQERAGAAAAGRFSHLGTTRDYAAGGVRWIDPSVSPLWAYQMQYLGAVLDLARVGDASSAADHLASWRSAFERRWHPVAWHPYPASLRLVNVCLAASVLGGFEPLGQRVAQLVAVHARFIERHLERDVRGNHLLENLVALLVAARYVDGAVADGGRSALALLRDELEEQVLADGTHFELSPMYHAIVLQRLLLLLDVVEDRRTHDLLAEKTESMSARLAWMLCPDGGLPLLGDSARGFAPAVRDLLPAGAACAPAGRSSAPDAGLHVLRDDPLWCILDAGPVCPEYLPAHGQADALTVEVWLGGACVVTDPGLHEYTGPERAWGRSSRAHSTITVDDRDSSEVYGSFRVGGRETMERVEAGDLSVTATLRPWQGAARLTRCASLPGGGVLRLDDTALAPAGAVARSRLHLHPDVEVLSGEGTGVLRLRAGSRGVTIAASGPLVLEPARCSRRFGELRASRIAVLVLTAHAADSHRGWLEIRPGEPA